MLHHTNIKPIDPDAYRPFVGADSLKELTALAKRFRGRKILQLSSTSQGGGVAEMVRSVVGLYRGLELDVTWQTFEPPAGFFDITKQIHNGLQGETAGVSAKDWQFYESVNRELAAELDPSRWDAIIIHDPQPAAVRHGFLKKRSGRRAPVWAWRCHIDTSHPDPVVAKRFVPFLKQYDGAIYSMKEYRLPGFTPSETAIIPPVIDPLAPKNQPMPGREAKQLITRYGINPKRPLVTQVSRFDRWKDPVGVIEAWKLARRQVPNLQLALVGNTVNDDPESFQVLAEVRQAAENESDIFIIENIPAAKNDRDVKAFYVASDVVVQKSIREGFGLTVSEALWAETPVVAGQVGGIVLQIESGKNGFLVSTADGAAAAIVKLIENPKLAKQLGQAGHEYVREHFLLPRLVADELTFLNAILKS